MLKEYTHLNMQTFMFYIFFSKFIVSLHLHNFFLHFIHMVIDLRLMGFLKLKFDGWRRFFYCLVLSYCYFIAHWVPDVTNFLTIYLNYGEIFENLVDTLINCN
jgi:hypothetical protein